MREVSGKRIHLLSGLCRSTVGPWFAVKTVGSASEPICKIECGLEFLGISARNDPLLRNF